MTVSVASAPVRTVLFALVYLAATIAGRLTIMDGTSLSMVWPAAGACPGRPLSGWPRCEHRTE